MLSGNIVKIRREQLFRSYKTVHNLDILTHASVINPYAANNSSTSGSVRNHDNEVLTQPLEGRTKDDDTGDAAMEKNNSASAVPYENEKACKQISVTYC